MKIDLTKGITETDQYKAWKFPGGEIHFFLKASKNSKNFENAVEFNIITRLNNSDDIIFLMLFVDTLKKDYKDKKINLFLPYMPYQQADRNFGKNECFSLKTITNLINSMNLNKITIGMPHSDVTPALLNNCEVTDNSDFIIKVLLELNIPDENLVICSPDAGSYKLIYKLCEKIGFKGDIITCSKSRNHETGELTTIVPRINESKDVLIIDDIALGSRTFFNIRNEIRNSNVYLAVSHGIFNENVNKLETEFTKIFTTNSRRDESVGKNIKVISIF
jgi:ribose-phosphate pyrophosphokinase